MEAPDGANPVASALTKGIDNLKLHERQEIVDPLYYPPASARMNRYSVPRNQIPSELWSEVSQRHSRGESLCQFAKVYGVSHGVVRQIVKRAPAAEKKAPMMIAET